MICSIFFLLASLIFFTYLTVEPSTFDLIPFHQHIEKGIVFLQNEATLSIAPSIQGYILPSVLLLFSLFYFLTRKTLHFWWVIPFAAIFYYSFYIFFQLRVLSPHPRFFMDRLLREPVMANVLMILLLLLEITFFILFMIISVKFYRKGRSTSKMAENTKVKQKEPEKKYTKQEDESPQNDQTLGFPEVESLPELKTLSFPPVAENALYVGKVSELSDNSYTLTDTPMEETGKDGDEQMTEKKIPFEALKKQLLKDKETRNLKVPTKLPSSVSTAVPSLSDSLFQAEPQKKEEEAVQRKEADAVEVNSEIPSTAMEAKKVEEPQMDDIDYVSGVGGLSGSSLLSRNKISYQRPSPDLLDSYPNHTSDIDQSIIDAGERLVETLRQFKIEANISAIVKGPTVTMYELTLAPGVRVSSISNLSDNIAMELAARTVRIVAPIPGKQAVGIEVPNEKRSIIGFKDLLSTVDPVKVPHLPMILGRKITGEPVVMDLTRTPHLLIAGATGSGKSVCVNSLINSLLYTKSPKEVRLILVDPKIVELRIYNGIPHLLTPVITEPKKTIKALEYCLYEMDRRYKLLNNLAVRNISAYNSKVKSQKIAREKLPYIVVVIDEFADIMTTVGKELETLLARLAAMARAVGIHLVLATQRPSADVITGIIKSNIPTRIAFTVSGQVNSRIIIDETGAEKLLGGGDMLFAPGWEPNTTRLQGAFLSDDEVERVVSYVKTQGEADYLDESFFEDETDDSSGSDDDSDDNSDEALREKAIKIIIDRNGASASYLQRRLRIGYNKAARMIEQLEDEGIVGPSRGSKPRELLRMPD